MSEFYAIESIRLTDYDGRTQECPVAQLLPMFQRTENRAPRFVEDKWLKWCNQIYRHTWTNIKLVIRYL